MRRLIVFSIISALFLLPGLNPAASAHGTSALNLTEEEHTWLEEHPVLRVANEQDWPPFDFNVDGEPCGMSIDYMNKLAEKVNLKIRYVHGYAWTELVELFKQKKIDIMPAFYQNDERRQYTLFTEPYYKAKLGVFVAKDSTNQPLDLVKMRVGMETSHGSIPIVRKLVPGIKIIEIDLKNDLIRQLATGKLDAAIGNPFVFYHLARENQVDSIQLATYLDMTAQQQADTSIHMGIHKDNPILHRIVQKAMDSMTREEIEAVKRPWTDVTIGRPINWSLILQISAGILLLLILLVWHNRRLDARVKVKTSELQALNEKLEHKVEQRTAKLTQLNTQLNTTIDELKTLRGIIPICASCKSIRDDSGSWKQIEAYVAEHSLAEFSHGVCPECAKKLYPEFSPKSHPENGEPD